MPTDLLTNLRPVVERLQALAKSDPAVRAELRSLAHALLDLTTEPVAVPGTEIVQVNLFTSPPQPPPLETARPTSMEITPEPSRLESASPPAARLRLDFAPTPLAPQPNFTQMAGVTDEDLPVIEQRCRLKAEAARYAARRARRLKAGDDSFVEFESEYRDLIGRAKSLPDCFLWMCRSDANHTGDSKAYDDLAGCYENAATVVDFVRRLINVDDADPVVLEQALHLTAEAQSALWNAVSTLNRFPDGDQLKLYDWLKDTGWQRRVWFDRFMTRTDPADPADWADLQSRILELESKLQSSQSRERHRRKVFGKIKHHLKRVAEEPADDHHEDWQTVIRSVVELVQDGIPASNVELRDLLLPLVDEVPETDDLPREFLLVLRELDRYMTLRPGRVENASLLPSEEVRRAGELLRDKAVVLIGGERRPGAKEALEEAFDLKELVWLEGRQHQSHTLFAADIARPDVALVLLAIRWSSHGFGEVKEYCDQHGKPLVRLPGGYNPNQVAYQVVSQVGEQLSQRRELVVG